MSSTLDDLLTELRLHAMLPAEHARLLPPAAYTHDGVLALERERIFASEWLCVGRTADVPARGDHVVREIAAADHDGVLSVVVARGDDDVVRVFANVCAHRCATLVVHDGNSSRLTCPYHAWVYRLDGQCIAAPFMQRTVEADGSPFDVANHRLHELATTEWEGFLYASHSATPEPLAPRVEGLTDVVARYGMAGYVAVAGGTDVWDTNWKCLTENFLDAYHVFKVHRDTFAKETDSTGTTTVYPGGAGFTHHVAVDDPASPYGVAHRDNTSLTGSWRHSTVLAAVFPSHVLQLQPDWLWYLVLSPLEVGRVHIRWSVAIAPEVWAAAADAERTETVQRVLALIQAVNAEDRPVIEGVWHGLRHRDAARGPFSYLEGNVHDIGTYVAARLTGNSPD